MLGSSYAHDFIKILKKLDSLGELQKINIKPLPKEEIKYIYSIETIDNRKFYVHSFTNIRYYPQPKKYSWDTNKEVLNTAEIMLEIANKVDQLRNP